MKKDLPPVKTTLSGLRACIREGKDYLVIQNNMSERLYFNLNGQEIIVPTNMFIGALNRILSYGKENTNEVQSDR